jgi:hypothetical protein
MLTVYWPTGLRATSINKLPILMLAVLPSEGSFHAAIINWQLPTRQWDADCFFHLHVVYQWVSSTMDWCHIALGQLGNTHYNCNKYTWTACPFSNHNIHFISSSQHINFLWAYIIRIPEYNFLFFNTLRPELNPICYLLALLAHDFLHVTRIRVK